MLSYATGNIAPNGPQTQGIVYTRAGAAGRRGPSRQTRCASEVLCCTFAYHIAPSVLPLSESTSVPSRLGDCVVVYRSGRQHVLMQDRHSALPL